MFCYFYEYAVIMSSANYVDTENLVGRWGESLDDFSDDEENIVPLGEDADANILDPDDVQTVLENMNGGQIVDVEDDVWEAIVAKLGMNNGSTCLGLR